MDRVKIEIPAGEEGTSDESVELHSLVRPNTQQPTREEINDGRGFFETIIQNFQRRPLRIYVSNNQRINTTEELFEKLSESNRCQHNEFLFDKFVGKNYRDRSKLRASRLTNKDELLQKVIELGMIGACSKLINNYGTSPDTWIKNVALKDKFDFKSCVDLGAHMAERRFCAVFHGVLCSPKAEWSLVKQVLEKILKDDSAEMVQLKMTIENRRCRICPNGQTTLHCAATQNRIELVNFLVKNFKPNIFATDKNGTAAFHTFTTDFIEEHFLDPNIKFQPHQSEETLLIDYKFFGCKKSSMVTDMEPLLLVADSKEHQKLLLHPIVVLFLMLKWRCHSSRYWLHLMITFLNFVCFSVYLCTVIDFSRYGRDIQNHCRSNHTRSEIMNNTEICSSIQDLSEKFCGVVFPNLTTKVQCVEQSHKSLAPVSQKYILLAILLSCNLMQFFSRLMYCRAPLRVFMWSWEAHLLKIVLVLMTLSFVVMEILNVPYFPPSLMAILCMSMSLDILFKVGEHRYFSIYIVILSRVTWDFCKILVWYISPIVAFAVSFHILLYDPGDQFFGHVGTSLFKTIFMVSGEFEVGSIDFHSSGIVARLLIIVLALFVTIVMVNMLCALAVADAQEIYKEAQMQCLIRQVKVIYSAELTGFRTLCGGELFPFLDGFVLLNQILKDNVVTILLAEDNKTKPAIHSWAKKHLGFNSVQYKLSRMIDPSQEVFAAAVKDAVRIAKGNQEKAAPKAISQEIHRAQITAQEREKLVEALEIISRILKIQTL